ncbi:MAG: efflux transporter outer membrane subunit [Myxococcota bacterium]|nr:efflux transporter outer membrane subunit [Myxococcota bacterium]
MLSALLGLACLAPKYTPPAAPVPTDFPQQVQAQNAQDLPPWQEAFTDPELQGLIQTALDNNRSLRTTLLSVEQARVQLRLSSSALAPQLGLEAGFTSVGTPASVSAFGEGYQVNQYRAGPTVSWQMDLFGQQRYARRASAVELSAAGEDWRAARISLIAQVASAALQERVLLQEQALAAQALADRQEYAELVRVKVEAGLASELDLHQANALVSSAQVTHAQLERGAAQAHNALVLLVGAPVAPLEALDRPAQELVRTTLDPGLPSELLLSRPDLRAAEQRLIAAHANIGAARAAFFPSISLTGGVNSASASLGGLFQQDTLAWSFTGPTVSLPIFDLGARRANLRGSKVAREQALASYEATIQTAFREVADVLVAWPTYEAQVAAQQELAQTQSLRVDLAEQRYEGGVSDYLEVLDAERERLTAELALREADLAQAQLAVSWFLVLGGGAESEVGIPEWESVRSEQP